jgi:outer membrane protein OmpA-like peptidoglycan-associated protein
MRRIAAVIIIGLLVVGLTGCASLSGRDRGVAIGAGSGAVIGGVIGAQSGNTALGAILGAVVGGAAGGVIGNYMDDQADEMEQDLEGARIERVGEGIKVTFDSGILFDVDKSDLRPIAQEHLMKLAEILNKYEDTDIILEGHTDSSGADDYNMGLSERRARAVSTFLMRQQVLPSRLTPMWYGESQPVADNTTIEGMQANRRVEVAIMANDKLKTWAEKETDG